ncbi:DUF6457 domain-containing protein [Corynebacterium uterequi]|uniref:DUF6457 domain-containing protein n=1 Tax=Corynebacterium uterequi TaxID=1072256 RepID=A0A0G3HCY4_9CORY|nr:DUF6457 domain-containing protein [Corynebacterium uterequi]AKK10580.1 hypothetical protein CUTER_02835 [Corynebacterium uterequi]
MAEDLTPTHQWLNDAAHALDTDPDLVAELVPDLLALTKVIAHHGPSRPAAPLTAFLVGYAAGAQGGDADGVRARIDAIKALLPDAD